MDEQDAKDLARYRWLRDPKTAVGPVLEKVVGMMDYDESTRTGGYNIYEYLGGDELDAAIDAAIARATGTTP